MDGTPLLSLCTQRTAEKLLHPLNQKIWTAQKLLHIKWIHVSSIFPEDPRSCNIYICYGNHPEWYIHNILVGGLEHVLFFHMLGISSSQLTLIFFRGVAQPSTSIYIYIHIINHTMFNDFCCCFVTASWDRWDALPDRRARARGKRGGGAASTAKTQVRRCGGRKNWDEDPTDIR